MSHSLLQAIPWAAGRRIFGQIRRATGRHPILLHSAALGLVSVLFFAAISALPLARAPILAEPGLALVDLAHRYQSTAPFPDGGGQLIVVDEPSWRAEIARAGNRVPAAVPARLTSEVIDKARSYRTPLLVVDIDVTIIHPPDEEARLAASLRAWAADPKAGVLLLARRASCAHDSASCERATTPYEAIVQQADNVFWVNPDVALDHRGTLRWIRVQREAGVDPNLAVLAAALIKPLADSDTPLAATRTAAREIKRCLGPARDSSNACIAIKISADDGRLMIPFGAAIPDTALLEDVDATGVTGPVSVRSAQDFLMRAWLGDASRTPIFFGATYRQAGDQFITPLGDRNGVAVLASTAIQWAGTGLPAPPSSMFSLCIAFGWGALVGAAVSATASLRRVLLRHVKGKRRKWVKRLVEPFALLPLAMLLANILSFLLLVQLPLSMTEWRVLSISGLLLSIVTTIKAIHDVLREMRDDLRADRRERDDAVPDGSGKTPSARMHGSQADRGAT